MVLITGVYRMGSCIIVANGGVHKVGPPIFATHADIIVADMVSTNQVRRLLLYFYAICTVHTLGYSPANCDC